MISSKGEEIKQFVEDFNSSLGMETIHIGKSNEIKQFKSDFNNKIEKAFDKYNKTLQSKEFNLRSLSQTQNLPKIKKEKKEENIDINNNTDSHWIPNNFYGKYFEKFRKLNLGHDLNNWEILRINHLLPKSYQKINELKNKIDLRPPNMINKLFDERIKENNNKFILAQPGKNIIKKFIDDNKRREKILRERDEYVYKYRHNKPFYPDNPWKFSNHIINPFMNVPADKIHSFRVERKKKFLVTDPFRIPKKDGDYFYQRPSNAINHY